MTLRILAVGTLFALLTSFASAGVTAVDFSSDTSVHHLAQFDGTATYDSNTGKLTIDICNTTAAGNGGFLTALALSATGPGAAFDETGSTFADLRNHKGVVNAPPFGKYHAGAGIGGKWSGGGDASQGVAVGESHEFVFGVTATGASEFTAADFLTPGKTEQEIVASFRKLKRHHSDRAGARIESSLRVLDNNGNALPQLVTETGLLPLDGNPQSGPAIISAVPVPPAAWLALSTFALIAACRNRSRAAIA